MQIWTNQVSVPHFPESDFFWDFFLSPLVLELVWTIFPGLIWQGSVTSECGRDTCISGYTQCLGNIRDNYV